MKNGKRVDRVVMRYSEAFKVQVVREYEAGEFSGLADAHRKYGIRGNGTVASWLKAYGKEHLMRKVMRVEAVGEADRIQKLEREVKQLKQALGEAKLETLVGEEFLRMACERGRLGGVEEFKKSSLGPCKDGGRGWARGEGDVPCGGDEPAELLSVPSGAPAPEGG
jgi:transposase-like protein